MAAFRRSAALLLAGALPACVGELRDLPGAVAADADTGGRGDLASDLAAAPEPRFFPSIARDLDDRGCSAAGMCHGGSATMPLIPFATLPADRMANYREVSARATTGADSPILRKPLAGSGVAHTGGPSFRSTMDPIYQRWLAWVLAGAPAGLDDLPDAAVDAGPTDADAPDGGS